MRPVVYFSMEVALSSDIPTYSGGLGVLAGDTLRSAADLSVPLVAVSMIYHKGYFKQKIDKSGVQHESPVEWQPSKFMQKIPGTINVTIENRIVKVGAWMYEIEGITGHIIPVIFLDTKIQGNSKYDQTLSDHLYGGDSRYRLCQETVLGIGGIKWLDHLGLVEDCGSFHMNEGHAALLTVGLLQKKLWGNSLENASKEDLEWVKSLCVFTTHTPVPAGHDQFPKNLVEKVLGTQTLKALQKFKMRLLTYSSRHHTKRLGINETF